MHTHTRTHAHTHTRTHRYDSRVKAMELDERPTEQYGDIGGLDKQIEEVSNTTLTKIVLYDMCQLYLVNK